MPEADCTDSLTKTRKNVLNNRNLIRAGTLKIAGSCSLNQNVILSMIRNLYTTLSFLSRSFLLGMCVSVTLWVNNGPDISKAEVDDSKNELGNVLNQLLHRHWFAHMGAHWSVLSRGHWPLVKTYIWFDWTRYSSKIPRDSATSKPLPNFGA